MVVYSITSTVWLVLIQPFMGVLFRGQQAAPTMSATPMPGLVGLQTALMTWLGAVPPLQAFGRLCTVILGLFLIRNLADYAAQYLSVSVEQAATRDLRRQLFAKLQQLPI